MYAYEIRVQTITRSGQRIFRDNYTTIHVVKSEVSLKEHEMWLKARDTETPEYSHKTMINWRILGHVESIEGMGQPSGERPKDKGDNT